MPQRPRTYATKFFPQQIDWEDGYSFVPPDAVGLGVDFDEEAVRAHVVDPVGWPPQLRRNDGAFTNW